MATIYWNGAKHSVHEKERGIMHIKRLFSDSIILVFLNLSPESNYYLLFHQKRYTNRDMCGFKKANNTGIYKERYR